MQDVKKLLITRKLPEAVEERARRHFEVSLNREDAVYSAEELIGKITDWQPDTIVCTPTERMDKELIGKLPACVKAIATYSVGYDHIAVDAARERGIAVSNTPDVLTEATADLTLLCLLGAARMASPAQRDLRAGAWRSWTPTQYLGMEMAGSKLGIVGMGRIGRATARRALGFGLDVYYWNRNPVPDAALEEAGSANVTYVESLEQLLGLCNIISLHVPATESTRKLIGRERLALMPRGSLLVNTARGALLDEAAVIEALESGHLMGVGLDVFENEPDFNRAFLGVENAFLLPHIGSATRAAREAMGFMALDNIESFFDRGSMLNPVLA